MTDPLAALDQRARALAHAERLGADDAQAGDLPRSRREIVAAVPLYAHSNLSQQQLEKAYQHGFNAVRQALAS